VANALTFFVNYYTYLAGFKSVVDRLNSFDAAIDQAEALSDAGPKHVASVAGIPAGRSSTRISATSSTNLIARKCGLSACPAASSNVWR
jgi:ABC-type uncharacterized transport system fused permease/ATPase subunit